MRIEVSKGELIDKITILEIKDERVTDENKLKNIRRELDTLLKYEFETPYKKDLKFVNNVLWDLEDGIRKCEADGDFGEEFIDKARNIYKYNDERARIKKNINLEQGSELLDECPHLITKYRFYCAWSIVPMSYIQMKEVLFWVAQVHKLYHPIV